MKLIDIFKNFFQVLKLKSAEKIKQNGLFNWKLFSIHFEHKDIDGEKDDSVPTTYDRRAAGAVRSAIFSLRLMKDILKNLNELKNRKDYIALFEETWVIPSSI
jgi:hypothetical protein